MNELDIKINHLDKREIFRTIQDKKMDYDQFNDYVDILTSHLHAKLILENGSLKARLSNATNLNNSILDEFANKGMVYRQPNASYSGDGLRLVWSQKNKAGVNIFVTMHIKPFSAIMYNIDHVLNSASGEPSRCINDVTITSRQSP